MKFADIEISGKIVQFTLLEHIMEDVGLIRAGQWDYERITYDYKFESMDSGDVYYLRVPCRAVEGEVESPYSMIEIMDPTLGKHYYPHGVEYDEEFPKNIVDKCKKLLNRIKEEVETHQQ
jgi:hypothetical protein